MERVKQREYSGSLSKLQFMLCTGTLQKDVLNIHLTFLLSIPVKIYISARLAYYFKTDSLSRLCDWR